MDPALSELLREWHDFYVLLGTASATLVGLMFVSASIGATVFNEKHRAALGAFISPTVVHFASVLFASLLITIPEHRWESLAALIGIGGIAGLIYSGRIVVQLIIRHRFNVDVTDRMFYALVPVVGYLLAMAAAVLGFVHSAVGTYVMAAGLLTLLAAGLRNAWDMTLWIMLRTPTSGGAPPA
jgi:lipid-A-disaccharide synthase-like uncharacterized protein